MGLVPGICTRCGATVSADREMNTMTCPYCGTSFVVERAVQQFTNIYHISAQNVYIQNGGKEDFKISKRKLEAYNGLAENVVVPEGVAIIGERAFENAPVKSVQLPDSVLIIEKGAFSGCKNLAALNLPSGIQKIGDGAFTGCGSLTALDLPSGLSMIGCHAFAGAGLVKIELPESVTELERGSLSHMCLKELYIRSCHLEMIAKAFEETVYLDKAGLDYENDYSTAATLERFFLDGRELTDSELIYGGLKGLYTLYMNTERRNRYLASPEGKKESREYEVKGWKQMGRCAHCGGYFGPAGLLRKKEICKDCGREKDY